MLAFASSLSSLKASSPHGELARYVTNKQNCVPFLCIRTIFDLNEQIFKMFCLVRNQEYRQGPKIVMGEGDEGCRVHY